MGDVARIGILIPVYQNTDKLIRTVWSLRQNLDLPAELVIQTEKQCVAKNRLAALEKCKSDIVIFMDDDLILPPFFASKLVLALQTLPRAGVVSAVMTAPDGSMQNDCGPGETREVLPPGTCFCYSRSQLKGVKFDAAYLGSQWEDTDFMMQVRAKGYLTYVTNDVWVLHDNNWTGHTDRTWARNKKRFEFKWPNMQAVTLSVTAGDN